MSTNADCRFYEKSPGEWFYKLQCYPYGETEEYDTFGPFATFEIAENHLSDNHANPGGFTVTSYERPVGEVAAILDAADQVSRVVRHSKNLSILANRVRQTTKGDDVELEILLATLLVAMNYNKCATVGEIIQNVRDVLGDE